MTISNVKWTQGDLDLGLDLVKNFMIHLAVDLKINPFEVEQMLLRKFMETALMPTLGTADDVYAALDKRDAIWSLVEDVNNKKFTDVPYEFTALTTTGLRIALHSLVNLKGSIKGYQNYDCDELINQLCSTAYIVYKDVDVSDMYGQTRPMEDYLDMIRTMLTDTLIVKGAGGF